MYEERQKLEPVILQTVQPNLTRAYANSSGAANEKTGRQINGGGHGRAGLQCYAVWAWSGRSLKDPEQ